MVKVDVRDLQVLQGAHKPSLVLRKVEVQEQVIACALQAQHHPAGCGRQAQEGGVCGQVLPHFLQVPQGAAFAVVRDVEDDGFVAAGDAGQVDDAARPLGGVAANELVHLAVVAGMQLGQRAHGVEFAFAFGVAKADAAHMPDKGVERMQVDPTGFLGADAKVVFFAVAFAKMGFVKVADGLQAGAADVHAKAHAGGHFDRMACQVRGKHLVEAGGGVASGQVVGLAKPRVAADGGVVRKRCDAGHLGAAVSGALDAVEPVVGHFGVAVEQQHVAVRVQAHAPVDGGHKAQVFFVFEQCDAGLLRSDLAQPLGDFGLGAAVVDDHQMPCGLAGAGQSREHAALGVFEAAVYRNDHVHRGVWAGQGAELIGLRQGDTVLFGQVQRRGRIR